MPLKAQAFANSDDVFLAWRSAKPIPDCIGFEIRRTRNGKTATVRNRVSFKSGEPDPTKPESSATSPIKRCTWTDHEVNSGDTVSYRVLPVIQPGGEPAFADELQASLPTKEVTLSGAVSDTFECYFNRGLVISQFMRRLLKGDLSAQNIKTFKKGITEDQENRIRQFLSGDLRKRLVELLADTRKKNGHIFAALFELFDNELIAGLEALGDRAHIVLSNGAHKARADDQNAAARERLNSAGCEVHDRMLGSGVLGHNKFLISCDPSQNAVAAWTGSTNWAPTGLCTQINNGLVINNPDVAAIFLEQWKRLRDAKDSTPKDLVAENSKVKEVTAGGASVNIWFTKSSNAPELDACKKLIEEAEEGILFLMFMPGSSVLLDAIVSRQTDKEDPLYVKGVVSTVNAAELDEAKVTLVRRGGMESHKFRILQPAGLKGVGKWAAEVSRGQFLSQVGHAIVHSKVIVIDPNGSKPITITGSHNFSKAATSKNDENLVIVEGDKALAQAYAVNIQSVADHYNFRAVAASMKEEGLDVTELMRDPKKWQAPWFHGDKFRELNFWLGAAAKSVGA